VESASFSLSFQELFTLRTLNVSRAINLSSSLTSLHGVIPSPDFYLPLCTPLFFYSLFCSTGRVSSLAFVPLPSFWPPYVFSGFRPFWPFAVCGVIFPFPSVELFLNRLFGPNTHDFPLTDLFAIIGPANPATVISEIRRLRPFSRKASLDVDTSAVLKMYAYIFYGLSPENSLFLVTPLNRQSAPHSFFRPLLPCAHWHLIYSYPAMPSDPFLPDPAFSCAETLSFLSPKLGVHLFFSFSMLREHCSYPPQCVLLRSFRLSVEQSLPITPESDITLSGCYTSLRFQHGLVRAWCASPLLVFFFPPHLFVGVLQPDFPFYAALQSH